MRQARDLAQIVSHFDLVGAPGEIGVRPCEPKLGKSMHRLRRGKSLCEKKNIGMLAVDFMNQPLPEYKWLGMWIVDTENSYTVPHPKSKNASDRLPERTPLFALKIERNDILILFRWVFGVRN